MVRLHLQKLLNARTYAEMAEKCRALTEAEIAAYNASPKNKDFFTPKNFGLDLTRSRTKFPYNVDARDYFCRNLIHALKGGQYRHVTLIFPEHYWTPYHLGAALDAHLDHARVEIRKIVDPHSSDDPDEDLRAARARARRTTVRHALLAWQIWAD